MLRDNEDNEMPIPEMDAATLLERSPVMKALFFYILEWRDKDKKLLVEEENA